MKELQSLHDALNSGDFYGENKHPFVPHLTIAQGQTTQEYEDIFGHLSMIGIQHKETLDKISLLYQLENGVWQWRGCWHSSPVILVHFCEAFSPLK